MARPHLVPGYGPSVWGGNVAMVQTTLRDLEREYGMQSDRNDRMHVGQEIPANVSAPTIGVDLDFQEALDYGVVSV